MKKTTFKILALLTATVLCLALCGCFTKGTGAGYDSYGRYSFEIKNTAQTDIYSVHMGLQNADMETDIDLLPGYLRIGQSQTVEGDIKDKTKWGITEWTIYITDMDDKTSIDYEIFDPWTVKTVEIIWDDAAQGYKCNFVY